FSSGPRISPGTHISSSPGCPVSTRHDSITRSTAHDEVHETAQIVRSVACSDHRACASAELEAQRLVRQASKNALDELHPVAAEKAVLAISYELVGAGISCADHG